MPPQSCPTMMALSLPSDLITAATSPTSRRHVVIFDAFGLVAQVVAALIDGDALKLVRKRRHLVAPRVPEIRKPVDHHDQRTLAEARVVNLHAVGIGVSVGDAGLDIGRVRDRREKRKQQ